MLCACDRIPPPTQKSRILVSIQQILLLLTLLYACFLVLSQPRIAVLYFISCILLLYAFTQLSYFCCVVLVTLDIISLLMLLNDLAVKFQN
jgi:hypothetical protein